MSPVQELAYGADAQTVSPHDAHQQAVSEWHEACNDYQQAEQRRAKARARLEEASKRLSDIIQRGMDDPTQPKAAYIEKAPQDFQR